MIQQRQLGDPVEKTCLDNQKTWTLLPELLFNWLYDLGFTICFSGPQYFPIKRGSSSSRLIHNSDPLNFFLEFGRNYLTHTFNFIGALSSGTSYLFSYLGITLQNLHLSNPKTAASTSLSCTESLNYC